MVCAVHKTPISKGKDGRWRTRVTVNGNSRQIAKSHRADLMDALYKHYYGNEDSTFAGMFEKFKAYKEQISAENTIVKYECDYRRFFEGTAFAAMEVDQITPEDCEVFIINRIRDLKLLKRAYEALWNYMKGTMKYAKNKRFISESPMDFLERRDYFRYCQVKKVSVADRTVSDKEFEKISQVIRRDVETKPNFMTVYAIELANLTGMRVGEIAALRWDAVDFENRIITVDKAEVFNQKSKTYSIEGTKTGKERWIPMTDDIVRLLETIRDVETQHGYLCEWVFANENGKIHKIAMVDCARNKSHQAGVKTKSIHSYRRTINSRMKANGISTEAAASMLGHTEEVNENNYTYDVSDMGYKREALERAQRSIFGQV